MPAGTKLRIGEANSIPGWGNGGGIRLDMIGQQTVELGHNYIKNCPNTVITVISIDKEKIIFMDYPLMVTPFILIPFKEMNKKQVEEYFNWFMQEKDKRIIQLENYIKLDIPDIVLEKTPESLIPLWDWFESHIEWEEKNQEEINAELKGRPEWMHPHILQSTKKESILTMALDTIVIMYMTF